MAGEEEKERQVKGRKRGVWKGTGRKGCGEGCSVRRQLLGSRNYAQ